jgi:outer membrane protein OmpA-like peptidoglycan-associated protein
VRWTDLADNADFFGLDDQPAAFDRTYNTADSIWINYPEAKMKDRFVPSGLRDDRMVRGAWEAAGRPSPVRAEEYESEVGRTGTPLFTKPISIQFRFNDAGLEPRAMALINTQVLPQVQIARSMFVRIEGNTDSVGHLAINQRLSWRRAQAVVDYLVSRGVARERLVARGNGPLKPVADNQTAEGRARNRRTDILFIPADRSSTSLSRR